MFKTVGPVEQNIAFFEPVFCGLLGVEVCRLHTAVVKGSASDDLGHAEGFHAGATLDERCRETVLHALTKILERYNLPLGFGSNRNLVGGEDLAGAVDDMLVAFDLRHDPALFLQRGQGDFDLLEKGRAHASLSDPAGAKLGEVAALEQAVKRQCNELG